MAVVDTVALSPMVKSFLAGSISGTCSTILFQPLDLVKTRLQQAPKHSLPFKNSYGGMLGVFEQVVKTEKVVGLWRGMIPSMLRCVPGVGVYFSSMHALKTAVVEEGGSLGPVQALFVGAGARTISGVLMIPMTVVKTRFESGVFRYSGVLNAVRTIYTKEGVKGLTCGLVPTLLRDAPFSGLYLLFYTQMKLRIPNDMQEGTVASVCHFGCGFTAGILASAVTQPFDVLKTKMQLYPHKFNNLIDVVIYVHRKYGYQGYFKGLVPRMMRRTLMAAMAWTVYEKVMISLQLK